MSNNDELFAQRWGFRRNNSDVDSPSNDQSRPCPVDEPKHKLQTVLSLPSHHGGEPNKVLSKSCKKLERKSCAAKTDKKTSDDKPFNSTLIDLRGCMDSLVEGVKVAREDLLKWMNNEMEESFKSNMTSKPAQVKTNTKRTRVPRSNPKWARRKSGTITLNPEDGSSDKLAVETNTSHATTDVAVQLNEPDGNAVSGTTAVEKNWNQKVKGKRVGPSAKKQKISEGQQIDNSEGGKTEFMKNQAMNLNSQMTFSPNPQQRNGIFTQNGLRTLGDYEQNKLPASGMIRMTGNGSGFPFGFSSQGLNTGVGILNFPSQFGLQYPSQGRIISGLRMNDNRGFNDGYVGYNQQLKMNAQGGVLPLHSPDNIGAANM